MGRKHLASKPGCLTKQLITSFHIQGHRDSHDRSRPPSDSSIDVHPYDSSPSSISKTSKSPTNKRPASDPIILSDSEDSSTSSSRSIKKCVSFANLDIRSYRLEIGDHPFCEVGCPLTLGWEVREELRDIPLDAYEANRCPRKAKSALRTTCEERRRRLIEDGYTESDLKRAERKMHRIRSCEARLAEKDTKMFFG